MLHSIVQYLYIYLLIIFGIFMFIVNYFEQITIGESFLYFYTLLLLPIFDFIIGSNFSKEKIRKFYPTGLNILKYIILILLALILLYLGIENIYAYMITFLLGTILFNVDSRVCFLFSLILFLYIPILIVIDQSGSAEILSMYAYYFLMMGIVIQIYGVLKNKYLK